MDLKEQQDFRRQLLLEDIRKKMTCKIANQTQIIPSEREVCLTNVETLSMISYNVWFERHNFAERSIELLKLFKKYSPDFICLQEVTPAFISQLANDETISNTYFFSSPSIKNYDILILSKHPCPFFARLFPTNMDRNLLFGNLTINNERITIATTHLESLSYNEVYRECQLRAIDEQLADSDHAIFMGDLNLEGKDEQNSIPESFEDAWNTLNAENSEEPGYTMPANSQYEAVRFDRILYRSKNKAWQPTKIEIIGKSRIPLYDDNREIKVDEVTTPSDHYGLYVEFTYHQQIPQQR